VFCEVVADFLTVTLAVPLGYGIYNSLSLGKNIHYPAKGLFGLAFLLALVMVLMLDRVGAYRRGSSLLRVRETEQVLRVSAEAFVIILAVSFFNSVLFSRWLLVLCLALVPLALFLQKTSMYLLIRALHSRGYGIEKVLIYGSGRTGRRVFSALKRSPKLGLDPVAFVDDDVAKAGSMVFEMGYERRRSAPIVRGPLNMELLKRHGIDLLIVAIPSIEPQKFTDTIEGTLGAKAKVSFVPGHADGSLIDIRILTGSFSRPSENRAAGADTMF
jgi:FlaA1/EpsC-like NDP-sugar epimerase